MSRNKTIALFVAILGLPILLYGASYWGQRQAHKSQTIVDAMFLPIVQVQADCFENRDWECVGRANKLTSDLTATRWRIIRDGRLVDSSVAERVDEFLLWHESLPPDMFDVPDSSDTDEEAGRSRSIADVIRPTPYIVNGKQVGYRVYPGEDRETFDSLGFGIGDLIVAIDGLPLDDPRLAFELFTRLDSGRPVKVEIESDGKSEVVEVPANWLDID